MTKALSAGATCCGIYANPKSGSQDSILRDGEVVGWDLHPGGILARTATCRFLSVPARRTGVDVRSGLHGCPKSSVRQVI
ncbi:hypothetical protein KUTG_05597 [Kutzneria sp. 744]|nr:hypothetical protein KUTG_05597 [Kutzneria sp. 744]